MIEPWEMPVGFASPYHTHHREDECFSVLEGKVACAVASGWRPLGAFVFGPRDIAHGLKATGEQPVRMLAI